MKHVFSRAIALSTVSVLAALPMVSYAQEANDETATDDTDANEENGDVIIVTGTKTNRSAFDTPTSVSTVTDDELKIFSAGSGSQADILQNLPGLNAEGGGGEVATNFRVRGLPSGGQFEFTPLSYDGLPVFSTFGLNSSAFDFFARNDLGIQRLEFVKGGVANLFGVGGQVGVINYISKTGTDETHGTFQLEVAEDNRFRGDFAIQGPVNENTFYAFSGFYRYDEGPLDSGLPTEGFALRGNLKHEFEDGSGYFQLGGSYINDRAQFFLPTVLDGVNRERVAGNDGETVFTLNSSAIDGINAPSPEGITTFDAGNGFRTVGGQIYAIFEKEFGNGWGFETRLKYSSFDSDSNFFNNGNGPNAAAPETQQQFLTARGLGPIANATFSFAETGTVLAATDLLFQNQFNDRERDATDATLEVNLTKELVTGSFIHNFTFGGFIARAEADNIQRNVAFLGDFTNNPELINVTIVNPADIANPFQVTAGGIIQAPSGFANENREVFRKALYLANQIEAGRLQFDIGFRVESQSVTNRFETAQSGLPSTLADNPFPGSAISTLTFGSGNFFEGDAEDTAWAGAGAISYLVNDNINVYANFSRGYFFPQVQGTGGQITSTGDIQVYEDERILQAALGFKLRNNFFDGYAEVFFTGLRDRNNVIFANNSPVPSVFATSSDTFGIELDGRFNINSNVTLTGNFIYQDHEFTEGDFIGNELNRLPNVIGNAGILLNGGGFDGSLFWNYNGSAFQDFGNGIQLDSFSIFRLDAGYTFDVGDDQSVRFSVNVWNLFNTQGLQEGNPRAGLTQAVGADDAFFVGRPVLPRRVTARLSFDF